MPNSATDGATGPSSTEQREPGTEPIAETDGPQYDGLIDLGGIQVPFAPRVIAPAIAAVLRNGRYETRERRLLNRVLRPGDRVLELGAGLGVCSVEASRFPGIDRVCTVEANPDLIPLIRETHRINGCADVDLRFGAITATAGEQVPFYLRDKFWASSTDAQAWHYTAMVNVPQIALADLIAEFRPTVLLCDIEGGEAGLFDRADLSGVRALIIELHPEIYGTETAAAVEAALNARGLYLDPRLRPDSVRVFLRSAKARAAAQAPTGPFVDKSWPPKAMRVLVATGLRDDGPFFLEWLAWHKAIGVTDIIVNTDGRDPGTDALLHLLDTAGEIARLPFSWRKSNTGADGPARSRHPRAIELYQGADFFLPLESSAFLNIRLGQGHLLDLIGATGPFDAVTITEIVHGTNGVEHYQPGWQIDLFPRHQTETPDDRRAQRKIRTLSRVSPRIVKIGGRRPGLHPGVRSSACWLDGSLNPAVDFIRHPAREAHDCRGTYGSVVLNRFALRSVDSFLAQRLHGDTLQPDAPSALRHFRRNDQDAESGLRPVHARALAAVEYARLLDLPGVAAAHQNCVEDHQAMIARVRSHPHYADWRSWIRDNAWGSPGVADGPGPDKA